MINYGGNGPVATKLVCGFLADAMRSHSIRYLTICLR